MKTNLAFSSSSLLLIVGTILATLILLIYVIRWWLSKNDQSKLSRKYQDWNWASPQGGAQQIS